MKGPDKESNITLCMVVKYPFSVRNFGFSCDTAVPVEMSINKNMGIRYRFITTNELYYSLTSSDTTFPSSSVITL